MYRLFVPAGITSSLFSSLLASRSIRTICSEIVGLVRVSADERKKEFLRSQNIVLKEYESDEEFLRLLTNERNIQGFSNVTRILWLSPHDDVRVIEMFRNNPMLVIGSGAIVDFYNGRIDLTTAPTSMVKYIQGKLRMSSSPYVTTIHPGFYLQDVAIPFQGGLHHETSQWLFAPAFDICKKWQGAAKYVTPVSYLCKMICMWIENPKDTEGKWYFCGSPRCYERWELRMLAESKEYLDAGKETYIKYAQWAEDYFPALDRINMGVVAKACKATAELYRK